MSELRDAEQRLLDLAEMLGSGEIGRREYRLARDRAKRRVEELTSQLKVGASPNAEQIEATDTALVAWIRADPLRPDQIERL